MTVNELIQKLVELARDGKGQWQVKRVNYDDGHEYATADFNVDIREDIKEIEIA